MSELINVELEQDTELQSSYELSGGIVPTGTINITTNGTHDVTSYANANVNVQGGVTPSGTKEIEVDSAGVITEDISSYANVEITVPQGSVSASGTVTANPTITVNSDTGRITANVDTIRQSFFPTITEGWVSTATFGAKAEGTKSYDMGTESAKTITPSTSTQRAISKGVFAIGNVDVAPIPSQYIIPTGTKSITANGTGIDVTQYASVDVNVSGGGNELPDFLKNTLTELIDDNGDVTSVVNDGCRSRTALTKIRLIGCTSIGDYAFYGCSNAVTIVLPSLTSNLDAREFQGCTNLEALDIKGYKIGFSGSANPPWLNDAKLDTIILRKSDSIVTLSPPSGVAYTFNGTPFASNGSGGTLYVPSALVNSYKTGTNWATWFADNGNHNNQVKAIEGSQYENYYADGTPIS